MFNDCPKAGYLTVFDGGRLGNQVLNSSTYFDLKKARPFYNLKHSKQCNFLKRYYDSMNFCPR